MLPFHSIKTTLPKTDVPRVTVPLFHFSLPVFLPQVAPIFNFFKIGFTQTKAKKFFMDVTQQAMHMRHDKASKVRRNTNFRSSHDLQNRSSLLAHTVVCGSALNKTDE